MTVDEILSAGMYTDRRGRTWHYVDTIVDYDRWQRWEHYSAEDLILEVNAMRLLIERDLHRDECPGLYNCMNHPVPIVWYGGISDGWCVDLGNWHPSLSAAMDAARALAVDE